MYANCISHSLSKSLLFDQLTSSCTALHVTPWYGNNANLFTLVLIKELVFVDTMSLQFIINMLYKL